MSDSPTTDAERLAIGCDPLQGERLGDLDDLRRVIHRLGYEGDDIPRTHWDHASWSCPQPDCDGGLELVDTSLRGFDPDDLDGSVDRTADEFFLHLSEAQSPNVPVVACFGCGQVFEVNFRRLFEPEAFDIPEPRIVETPGTLSGRPRIDGTRIGVEHIVGHHERGEDAEHIASETYPSLTVEHVEAAIEWARFCFSKPSIARTSVSSSSLVGSETTSPL
jgi:uncharacterized protein (DUF433 family)